MFPVLRKIAEEVPGLAFPNKIRPKRAVTFNKVTINQHSASSLTMRSAIPVEAMFAVVELHVHCLPSPSAELRPSRLPVEQPEGLVGLASADMLERVNSAGDPLCPM